jgi:type IV pilus assembly protein PilA
MRKIRTSKKGFTLAELLIVVAIIGVLVGISIPIFSAQLRKSRVATDQANARAAKAAFTAYYLDDDNALTDTIYYDADAGKADKATPANGYGETSDAKADDGIPGVTSSTATDLTDCYVKGTYDSTTDTVVLEWVS